MRPDLAMVPTPTADLVLTGELDVANCARIAAEVATLCEQGRRRIRIDLGAVTFIDAATLGAFVQSHECARAFGADVVLASAHGLPLRLLRMFGLDAMLIDIGPSGG
jgi:anti-sigma B factor antagonist